MSSKPFFFLLFIPILFVGIFFASEVKAVNCTPSASGNLTISTDCSFPGTVNGVEGGMTINTGKSMTIQAGQTIVWNPGSSITVNGTININSTGQLRQSFIWMVDADADGYASNTTMYVGDTTPGATYRRRSLLTSHTIADLDDTNGAITTYAYSQSTYYAYSQSTYYAYSQSTYYTYSQSTYTPAKTCSFSNSCASAKTIAVTALNSACSAYCVVGSPTRTCQSQTSTHPVSAGAKIQQSANFSDCSYGSPHTHSTNNVPYCRVKPSGTYWYGAACSGLSATCTCG